jgi:hypothetical protein
MSVKRGEDPLMLRNADHDEHLGAVLTGSLHGLRECASGAD